MKDSPEMEWFKKTYQGTFQDLSGVSDWKVLKNAAIFRKHTGDVDGAIEAMVKAIGLTRAVPNLLEETVLNLNFLAADLYLAKNANEKAEVAIREAVELSRSLSPNLLADNLLVLAAVLCQQGEHRAALASAEEARQLYQQQGHSYGVGQAEELIGRIRPNLQSPA